MTTNAPPLSRLAGLVLGSTLWIYVFVCMCSRRRRLPFGVKESDRN